MAKKQPTLPPNRKARRAAQFQFQPVRHPMAPMPIPYGWKRRIFLRLFRWKVKARHHDRRHIVFLRSVGAGSLLLGTVGLMQTFFMFSVVCIYLGLIILFWDIALENLNPFWRSSLLFAIAVLAALFTNQVVMHKSPVSFNYRTEGTRLVMSIRNDSDEDDYRDFDIKIFPDSDIRSLTSVGQLEITNNPGGCVPINNAPDEMTKGESELFTASGPHNWMVYSNNVRITCPRIPSRSHLAIALQLVQPTIVDGKISQPIFPVLPSKAPSFHCKFTGKFRNIDIDNAVFARQQ